MAIIEVKVPDIGDFKDVAIIELLVKPGDTVRTEQSLVTVESDKASMEIPSSASGIVRELKVGLGDKVSEGSTLLLLETAAEAAAPAPASAPAAAAPAGAGTPVTAPLAGTIWKVLASEGQTVAAGEVLLILEAMKMETEIRAAQAGTVRGIAVKAGDAVAVGDTLLQLA